MTENTETTATALPAATPKLNEALAAVQAEMPPIGKDGTGEIKGVDKYGKPFSYKYNYADLAAICAVAYPITGKHGLSFSAQPNLTPEGRFVLEYQLRHVSGEQIGGVIPLPAAGKPQELGSVLTYYKRYAFSAVTGIQPGGEDNDAATANHDQQYDTRSAADAFEEAAPASKPHRAAPPSPQAAQDATPPADEDQDWGDWTDVVKDIRTAEDADKADADLKEVFKAGNMPPGKANAIRTAILARRDQVTANGRVPA